MVNNVASTAGLVAVVAATVPLSETEDLVELTQSPTLDEAQELTETPDNFLTKPFDDYTTTEGLLFCILVILVLSGLGSLLRRFTSWL